MRMPIEVAGREYLNTTEAAAFLGITRATLVKKVREWGIDAYEAEIGKAKYYPKSELKKHLGLRPAPRPETS